MDIKDIEELVRCPVCFDVPTKEIFQCPDGHLVCQKCSTNLDKCPQCRVSYGGMKIRNRAVESILDGMPFECPNQPLGCQTVLPRRELAQHSKICTFNKALVKICKLIGYPSCKHQVNTHMISAQFLRHLEGVHGAVVSEGPQVTLAHEGFGQSCESNINSEVTWTPTVLNVKGNEFEEFVHNEQFLIFSIINNDTNTISWSCLHLNESADDEAPYFAQFSIKRPSVTQTKMLTWRKPVIKLGTAETMLQSHPHLYMLDTRLLTEDYLKDDCLTVSVTITKKNVAPKEPHETETNAPIVHLFAELGHNQSGLGSLGNSLDGLERMFNWIHHWAEHISQLNTGNGIDMSRVEDFVVNLRRPRNWIDSRASTFVGLIFCTTMLLLCCMTLYDICVGYL